MARRGVMTALQAALAGIGGAAGGYVQMEETKRKRMVEDEERKQRQSALEAGLQAGIRSEQRDILKGGGTRIAGMSEQVAGPVPSIIPLSGVGNAFAAAEAAGGPATSRGALRQTVGESSFLLPGAAEQDESALRRSLRVTEETGAVKSRQDREAFDTTNRGNFEVYKQAYGGRGEYNPQMNYEKLLGVMGSQATLRQERELAMMRMAGAGAGGTGGAGAPGAPGERGPLPSVLEAIDFIDNLSEDDIKKLSGRGVAYATAAPMTMASGAQGFTGAALGPLISGMQYGVASEEDRRYAEYASMVARQVARLNEKGVLSNQDVNDYKTQTGFISGETDAGKARKAQRLKEWAQWIANVEENPETTEQPLPGESAQRSQLRNAPMRRTAVPGSTRTTGVPNNPGEWD